MTKLEVIPNDNNEPCIHWDNGYKLTLIGEPGAIIQLPGKAYSKTGDQQYDYFFDDEAIKHNKNVLIFGEHGSGTRNFQSWLSKKLDALTRNWLFVTGDDWDKDAFKKGGPWQKQSDDSCEICIEALAKQKDATAFFQWVKTLDQPCHVIIRNLSALGKKRAVRVATIFRRMVERNPDSKLHIMIINSSDSIFQNTEDHSGYSPLCYQYRLPFFNLEEIKKLIAAYKYPFEFEESALDHFIVHTGGQPTLTRYLLQNIQEFSGDDKIITKNHVDRAAHQIRNYPSPKIDCWKTDLQPILQGNPLLVHRMERYISGYTLGESRFPPRAVDRPLFISGWLKLNQMQRWGITSSLHSALAWEVIQQLKKERVR